MGIAVIVPQGLETFACQEVEEITGLSSSKGNGWVMTESCSWVHAAQLAYRSQLASMVLYGAECVSKDKEDIEFLISHAVSLMDLKGMLPSGSSFAARGLNNGGGRESSVEIASVLGAAIKDRVSAVVNLSCPDRVFVCVVSSDVILVGLDVACVDLGKRPYRLFQWGPAVKAPLAYAVVRESMWNEKMVLLDMWCHAGSVVIEAALFGSHSSPQRFTKERLWVYNKMTSLEKEIQKVFDGVDTPSSIISGSITASDPLFGALSSAKKNAKLAGVDSLIKFQKSNFDELDLKFPEESVDAIASIPLLPGPLLNQSKLSGLYQKSLVQANTILKKSGRIVLLVKSVELWNSHIQSASFCIESETVVYQGKEQWIMMCLSKK